VKPTLARRSAPDLSPARIAAAGLALVDEQGVASFTMRAVAERLGVTPMALYHHVADKAALARLMIEAAIDEHPLAPSTGNWREDAFAMACWMRDSFYAHPALGRLRREHQVWTPSMLRFTERWLNIWRHSGLALPLAIKAAAASSLAIVGLVNEEAAFQQMDRPDRTALRHTPDAALLFDAPAGAESMFELSARGIIDGVYSRLASS
jgi:AcrR family transcriptional regulator